MWNSEGNFLFEWEIVKNECKVLVSNHQKRTGFKRNGLLRDISKSLRWLPSKISSFLSMEKTVIISKKSIFSYGTKHIFIAHTWTPETVDLSDLSNGTIIARIPSQKGTTAISYCDNTNKLIVAAQGSIQLWQNWVGWVGVKTLIIIIPQLFEKKLVLINTKL